MSIDLIKAFHTAVGMKSFFLALALTTGALSAAEVTRSLSQEDRIRLMEKQLSSANRMRAESQFEITNLKNEVRELRGLVEEQGYQLQQIIKRQRELYRDIDRRLTQPGEGELATTDISQSPADSVPVNQGAETIPEDGSLNNGVVTETVTPVPTVEQPLNDVQIRAIYDQIFPLVRNKQYDEAIAEYQQFVARYPNSLYVANARYWLAQIYAVQGRTDEAELEYLNVAQKHTESSKAADAWLKLGQLYERQAKTDKAMNAYNQVVTQYSDSTAAKMAENRLQVLKAGG